MNSNSSSSNGTSVSTSICPKGWTLPIAGTSDNNKDGSFYNMLNKYNLASVTLPSGTNATSNASVSPLFFPRAGFILTSSRYSDGVGREGYSWSSTIADVVGAYLLNFVESTVNPSYNGVNRDRYRAFPVRCLVN